MLPKLEEGKDKDFVRKRFCCVWILEIEKADRIIVSGAQLVVGDGNRLGRVWKLDFW